MIKETGLKRVLFLFHAIKTPPIMKRMNTLGGYYYENKKDI